MNKVSRIQFDTEGNQLSVLSCGNPADPKVIFLHGIPASAELWRNILPVVAQQGFYCLAPDCPGYGQTEVHQVNYYSLAGAAQLFQKWIVQEDWQDIWLVGHDLGGGIAQIMIANDANRFVKVSLSNCPVDRSWPVPIIKLMSMIAKLGLFPFVARTGLAQLFGASSLKKGFHNREQLTSAIKEHIFFDSKMSTTGGRKKFAHLLRQLSNNDTSAIVDQLQQTPLLVHLIWGMKDPHQPWPISGQLLYELLPNVRVTELKKAGHFLQLDDPDAYLKALLVSLPNTP